MADIDLVTADKVNVGTLPQLQHTFVANAAITAGAPVYVVAASGKVAHADANGAGVIASCWGVAARTVAAGEAVTVIREGVMDGWDLSGLDYGDPVYVSDTVGRLADAAGTTPIFVGTVIPAHSVGLGVAYDKVLLVDAANTAAGAAAGLTALTDNTGGTANDTLTALGGLTTLTDSTGLSGTHDDTLAATTVPGALTVTDGAGTNDGTIGAITDNASTITAVQELAAKQNAVLTLLGVMAQNDSDTAQKVIELVADMEDCRNNFADLAAKVNQIIAAL